ncbi:MAG: hypothetical protein KGO05_11805, partial [Chloroflexota bacterium]|nr:hypothetical protein [Chloroflexota bacterium]
AALEEVRERLMGLVAQRTGAERPMQGFEREAPAALQAALARTLGTWEAASIGAALLAACDLLATRLDAFTAGQTQLTEGERATLAAARERIAQALADAR